MIQHFGLFSALGVAFALILTITFSPALLVYWPLPRKHRNGAQSKRIKVPNLLDRALAASARAVTKRPKPVLAFFALIILFSIMVIPQLKIEGGQMSNFKPDNPIRVSGEFINEKLTGTSQFNLLFKYRSELNLSNEWAQNSLLELEQEFANQWQSFKLSNNLASSNVDQFITASSQRVANKEFSSIKAELKIISQVFDEEYTFAVPVIETSNQQASNTSAGDLNALQSLDELEGLDGLDELSNLDDLDDSGDLSGLGDANGVDGWADINATSATQSGIPTVLLDLNQEQIAGLKQINQTMDYAEDDWLITAQQIMQLRLAIEDGRGVELQRSFNQLTDLFEVNVKQPHVLHRIQAFKQAAQQLDSPMVQINGQERMPTGLVTSPVDLIRKFYMVFYQDNNPSYNRLPNTLTDPMMDKTLTDRSVIGVVVNQAQSGSRETFSAMISPDLTEFQVSVMGRSDSSVFVSAYQAHLLATAHSIFPDNDPYIEKVTLAGYAPTVTELMDLISSSQIKSIGLAFILVFMVTFFIFRSALGGLFSILPLVLTVVANFATMWVLGWDINTGTMLVASISVGIGVDYTIHFLERFKIQLRQGDSLAQAYANTVATSGKAIIINALSVSFGFLVLTASDFVSNIAMGILMAGTMVYSALGALIMLPALILIFRPKFFNKHLASQQQD